MRNYCQLAKRKDVRIRNKGIYNGWKYCLLLKMTVKILRLVVTNTKYLKDIAIGLDILLAF